MSKPEFKYIKNYTEQGEGVICLYDAIGTVVDESGEMCYGISGSAFAQEMQYLQKMCNVISIRINSVGGSVLDGYSIVSAILNSKVPCNTYIDGLAASIAGVIAVAGKKCYMADYGQMMIHEVSGEDKAIAKLFQDTLVTLLSNRSKKTPDEINEMMKKETWLTASEALKMGFADEIVKSDKKMKPTKEKNLYALVNKYNDLLNKNPMKKTTNLLNIAEDSSDDLISSKITEIKNKLAEKEAEATTLKTENEALKKDKNDSVEAEKTALKTDAETLLNKAEADKKITADEKKDLMVTATESRAGFKNVATMISKIGTVKNAGDSRVDKTIDLEAVKNAGREKWTIRDWEKQDPKGLQEIHDTNKALYDTMYNSFYKK